MHQIPRSKAPGPCRQMQETPAVPAAAADESRRMSEHLQKGDNFHHQDERWHAHACRAACRRRADKSVPSCADEAARFLRYPEAASDTCRAAPSEGCAARARANGTPQPLGILSFAAEAHRLPRCAVLPQSFSKNAVWFQLREVPAFISSPYFAAAQFSPV